MIREFDAGVAWAAWLWDRRVVDAQRLSGGWTSTMLRLTAVGGERAVLRLMTRLPWRRHAAELLTREADTQRGLSGSAIPAPVSIAVDPEGSAAGAPAHLMTWLPGRLALAGADDLLLHRLARQLVAIHRHDPGPRRPRTYQSWAPVEKRVVPPWAGRPDLWRAAFALLDAEPPPYQGRFLHRDFHLGNVLWVEGEISGVVDWPETSWGPAWLDVAHCTTYLAMLHGAEAATRFTDEYRKLDPAAATTTDPRYWEVLDIVGYLPDPTKVAQPWRDAGCDVSDGQARARLEDRLAEVLDTRPPGTSPRLTR